MSIVQDLEAMEKAATPRPWRSNGGATAEEPGHPFTEEGASIDGPEPRMEVIVGGQQDEQGGAVGVLRNEDAALIVALRNAAPELLALVRAARAHLPCACSVHRDAKGGEVHQPECPRAVLGALEGTWSTGR